MSPRGCTPERCQISTDRRKKLQTVRMLSEPRRDWPYLSKSLTSKLTNYFWLIQQLKILNDIPDKLFAQCGPAIPVI